MAKEISKKIKVHKVGSKGKYGTYSKAIGELEINEIKGWVKLKRVVAYYTFIEKNTHRGFSVHLFQFFIWKPLLSLDVNIKGVKIWVLLDNYSCLCKDNTKVQQV